MTSHFLPTGGLRPAGLVYKDPAAHFPMGLRMAGYFPAGRTLSKATVSALDLVDNSDATSLVLARTTATLPGNEVVEVGVKAGTLGHRYELRYAITDSGNNLYIETLLMQVR